MLSLQLSPQTLEHPHLEGKGLQPSNAPASLHCSLPTQPDAQKRMLVRKRNTGPGCIDAFLPGIGHCTH